MRSRSLPLGIVPFLFTFIVFCGFVLSLPAQEVETLGTKELQADTLNHITMMDRAMVPACKMERHVLKMEITKKPSRLKIESGRVMRGEWKERWTIDSCGQAVAYEVTYRADGRGGTFISTNSGKEHLGPGTRPLNVDNELLVAAEEGNVGKIEDILNQKANLEVRNVHGLTPLVIAVTKGHAEAVKLLLSKGSDLKANYAGGVFAIHVADNPEVLRVLMAGGADLMQRNPTNGGLPIHYAAFFGKLEVVRALLAMGVKVDATDDRGDTALILAARFGQIEAVRLLLEKGADPNLKNQAGQDAEKSAEKEEIRTLLRDAKKK